MPEIIFDNVSKEIHKTKVIQEVTLHIPNNTIFGLKGVNGSGKTMLMRLIAGLVTPTSGKILIDNKQIGKDMDFPSGLGMLLENPAFLNRYNGFDNLRILADIAGIADENRIQDVMQEVGLAENGTKKYRKFSLGMKQRLGIAAAILENPSLLILDEPTNSLDQSGVDMVRKIILHAKSTGTTVVLSCHDNDFLEQVCDEVACLEFGKMTQTYFPCRR